MPKLNYERRVNYTPLQMLDLVADVESYPDFVPHCSATQVWRDLGETDRCKARLHVQFGPISRTYTSNVTVDREKMTLTANAIDGPFSHLNSGWQFFTEGEGALVKFDIDFGFSNPLIRVVAERAFAAKQDEILDAFMQRARTVYGPR